MLMCSIMTNCDLIQYEELHCESSTQDETGSQNDVTCLTAATLTLASDIYIKILPQNAM
jgi:hypothetical protein